MKNLIIALFASTVVCAATSASARGRDDTGFSRSGPSTPASETRAPAATRSFSGPRVTRPMESARSSGSSRTERPAVTRSYTPPAVSTRPTPSFRVERDTAARPAETARTFPSVPSTPTTRVTENRVPSTVRDPTPVITSRPSNRSLPTYERPTVQTPDLPTRTRTVDALRPTVRTPSTTTRTVDTGTPRLQTPTGSFPTRDADTAKPLGRTPTDPTRLRSVDLGTPRVVRTPSAISSERPANAGLPHIQAPSAIRATRPGVDTGSTHVQTPAPDHTRPSDTTQPLDRTPGTPVIRTQPTREKPGNTSRLTITHTPSRIPTPNRQISVNQFPSRETLRENTRLNPTESRIEMNGKHPSTAIRSVSPIRTKPDSRPRNPFLDHPQFSGTRHSDGRTAVYRGPERRSPHQESFRDGHYDRDRHDHHNGRPSYHFDPWTFRYTSHAFVPVYYGAPVYAPVTGFGVSWGHGSFGFSFSSYWPTYCHTRYYDSWHCGGWGYSNLYYDGWRHGWYGGVSYIYNPWPVYRTYYLYEPAPVYSETVYVTQPAVATTVVATPATVTTAAPQTTAPIITATPATAIPEVWEAAPAVQQVETVTEGCFCPCHCNGQRPCICDYPCGSEYAVKDEDFDLSLGFGSYAETLNAESIWTSYAGMDRWDPEAETSPFGASISTDSTPY